MQLLLLLHVLEPCKRAIALLKGFKVALQKGFEVALQTGYES